MIRQSLMRTLVPIVYALLARYGLGQILGNDLLIEVASLGAAGLIYLALRVLEKHRRWIGWLLGAAGAPSYDPHPDVVTMRDELAAHFAQLEELLVPRILASMDATGKVLVDRIAPPSIDPATVTKKTAAKRPAARSRAKS